MTTQAWYLTTYLSPPGLSALMGIAPRHDANLSLWRLSRTRGGGTRLELVRHWELERLSGEKQHARPFPSVASARSFIGGLLHAEGLTWQDISACWGTPGLDFGGGYGTPVPGLPMHAVAHAYSALYLDCDVFHGSRVLCFAPDGGPDHILGRTLMWYAGAYSDRGHCEWFPAESPGRIYASARKAFGLREGTLMALAAAGPADLPVDGGSLVADERFYGAAPHDLLGGAVAAGERVLARATAVVDRHFGACPPELPGLTGAEVRTAAVMRLLQAAAEAVMVRNVERFLAATDVDPATVHLGLAGGYALNCPTNTMLMERYGFAGLLAPPCANDSGQALGVGLALLHQRFPGMEFSLGSAYHGPAVVDLAGAADAFGGAVRVEAPADAAATFVADIERGPVAWLAGPSEIGPRALGHRSLLADPRLASSKDKLNAVKERQWWRPVAPIVLAEDAADWFELTRESRYMLETAQVRAERAARVPAIAHLDGSARLQTLSRADDPRLHAMLAAFRDRTGVPMLCNTSLNGPGQPIIQTAQQALAFCVERAIGVCYIDGCRLVIEPTAATPTLPRYNFPAETAMPPGAAVTLNPHGLTGPELYHLMTVPDLHGTDITTDDGASRVRAAAAAHYRRFPADLRWVSGFLNRGRTAATPPPRPDREKPVTRAGV